MGIYFADTFSLLHFAVGIVFYYWGVSLKMFILLHILFEYIENTTIGMSIINNNFKGIWPGGKDHPDTQINQFGDIIFGIIGWLVAYYINQSVPHSTLTIL